MDFRFDDGLRDRLAACCAGFARATPPAPIPALRPAAVALTLVELPDRPGAAGFLLTRRADGLRAHGGQWALPGGRCDPGETPVETARRELAEELGLALASEHALGLLDDYPTRSGYLITPVVLWAGQAAALTPNPHEVASVHHIPLDAIARAETVDFFTVPESQRLGVRLRINGEFVDAPTAAVIYQFRELLAGRATRVADFEQPHFAWR